MGSPLDGPIEESVHLRIKDQLVGHIPGIAGNLWINPAIEYLAYWSGD
jgi:hypothetical protein